MIRRDEQTRTTDDERWEVLRTIESWLETPMVVLGFVWLAILVAELLVGDHPVLRITGALIWVVFLVDFVVRLVLAPLRLSYLRTNWITAVALVIPAFRVLRFGRVFRALSAARGIKLARLVTSLNRGMSALGRAMERRGVGYVAVLTLVVIASGAAGMFAFEGAGKGGEIGSYFEALWWTSMLLTTIGSEYWPVTPEGRALALLLSVYALGVLGYITATLASFFVGRDAESVTGEVVGGADLRELRSEIAALRRELRSPVERGGS